MSPRLVRGLALAAIVVSIAITAWDLSIPGLLDRTGRMKCPDFLQFYTFGALARTGRAAMLYDGDAHASIARETIDPRLVLMNFHPDYSPTVAWVMAPLSTLPYLRAMALWSVVSVGLFAVSVLLLLGLTARVREDPITLWLAALGWPALMMVLRYGQISAASLALVAAAIALDAKGRQLAAGLALGCLVYKPNLLGTAALVLVAARGWRVLGGLAAAAIGQTVLAVVSVGPSVFAQYLGVLWSVARDPSLIQMFPTESHSIAGAVRMLLPWRPAVAAATVAGLALCVWAAARVWISECDARPRWSALVLAMLAASPHLLTYDLLLLAVPLVLLTDWWCDRIGTAPRGAALVALVLLYAGAWPGTLLARLYGVQISTIGMGLALALLFQQSQHQLVRREAENRVIDGAAP